MAENENIVVDEMPPETQPQPEQSKVKAFFAKVWAGIKEWTRKQVVTLKRFPQRIPLAITVITSVLWLIWLFTFSQAASSLLLVNTLGLLVFANTLISILVLPLFLNAFPKRKKPNIVFIVLVFVFLAALIALDVVYFVQVSADIANRSTAWLSQRPFIRESLTLVIVHLVFVALSVIILALLPVYAPLIKKINTAKNIDGNDLHEHIDIEDDE